MAKSLRAFFGESVYPVWKSASERFKGRPELNINLPISLVQTMKTKKAKASRSHPARSGAKGPIRPAANMPIINGHAAGVDVGSVEHYVCVPADAVPAGQSNVRGFGGFTEDLNQLVEWLQGCAVTTVAMESTGVYWIALAQKLEEAGIEVVLVNARHLKYVPGRKSDVKD